MKVKPKKITAAERKEIEFLECLARRCPEDISILKALADMLTKAGRHEDGLATDVRLSRMCPDDPQVWYNLACSYALTNMRAEALLALERAVDKGYRDLHWLIEDKDLESLKTDKRFHSILLRLQKSA